MSDLASTAVTLEDYWYEGGVQDKKLKAHKLVLNLSGQGTTTNKIPASVLQLTKIVDASHAIKHDNSVFVMAGPDYTGANLLLKNAGSNAPADYSGQFRIVVRGT